MLAKRNNRGQTPLFTLFTGSPQSASPAGRETSAKKRFDPCQEAFRSNRPVSARPDTPPQRAQPLLAGVILLPSHGFENVSRQVLVNLVVPGNRLFFPRPLIQIDIVITTGTEKNTALLLQLAK